MKRIRFYIKTLQFFSLENNTTIDMFGKNKNTE